MVRLKYGGNIIEIWPTAEILKLILLDTGYLLKLKRLKYSGNRSEA